MVLCLLVCLFLLRNKVAACAKHFVGDGGTTNGINENNTVIDYNGLLSIHMPAYLDAVKKGVATVMVSYSSWNGKKMHANRDLVTGFLKNKLKFKVRERKVARESDVISFYSCCILLFANEQTELRI